jgi:hypothetical protein
MSWVPNNGLVIPVAGDNPGTLQDELAGDTLVTVPSLIGVAPNRHVQLGGSAAMVALATAYNNGGANTFGSDLQDWNLTGLACDTKGPFRLTVCGFSKTTAANSIQLLWNGVNVSDGGTHDTGTALSGEYANTIGTNPTLYGAQHNFSFALATPNRVSGVAGKPWTIVLECMNPWSVCAPARKVKTSSIYLDTGPGTMSIVDFSINVILAGELDSIGLHGSVAGEMASTSFWSLVRL